LVLSSSKEVALKEELSLLVAFGMPGNGQQNEQGHWHNPFSYTRFFLNEQTVNPDEQMPNAPMLPLRPLAFGDEIVEQVFVYFLIIFSGLKKTLKIAQKLGIYKA
jgi:hypothetical protein